MYEGCGWDRVGVHARRYNPTGLGISVIGNYQNCLPNSAALDAVRQEADCVRSFNGNNATTNVSDKTQLKMIIT